MVHDVVIAVHSYFRRKLGNTRSNSGLLDPEYEPTYTNDHV